MNYAPWIAIAIGLVINLVAAAAAVHYVVSGVRTEQAVSRKDIDRHERKIEIHDSELKTLSLDLRHNADLVAGMSEKVSKTANDTEHIRAYEHQVLSGVAAVKLLLDEIRRNQSIREGPEKKA